MYIVLILMDHFRTVFNSFGQVKLKSCLLKNNFRQVCLSLRLTISLV